MLLVLGIFTCLAAMAALFGGVLAYRALAAELSDDLTRLQSASNANDFETNYIYDRNGQLLYEFFGEGRRTRIALADVPPAVISATIATEDKTFWENPGVDPPAIARALYQNVRGGRIESGASTITQQLVRQLAFPYDERVEQSFQRKAKEAMMAVIFARQHSKPEVLELYLNEIYYGSLAYGIEAAAQTYFDKPALELTIGESALLAGLPQAPLDYNPFEDLGAAKARQRVVLDLMVDNGYLTQEQADDAFAQPLKFVEPTVNLKAPHFSNYVKEELERRLGARVVARGGLVITTTIDLALNDAVQQIVQARVKELEATNNLHNAAVVVLKPGDGEILAMVGSADYYNDAIDGEVNVTMRDRQPGSSIKPLTYVTAFENGLTNASVIWDAPMRIGDYEPQNYDGRFRGPMLPRMALANSLNIPAVKVLKFVGVPRVLDNAHRMGITGLRNSPDYYGLSLTLGGGEVTLLDLSTAYGTLANGGGFVTSTPFLKITDSRGEVLYDLAAQLPVPQPAVDPRAAYLVTNILSDNAARCPAFGCPNLLELSRPAAVKTGTTNDFKDNWTVGYTPYVVTGVWAGNSDNSAMINSTGITGAAPIWHDVMELIFATPQFLHETAIGNRVPQDGFNAPAGIVRAPVCDPQTTHGGRPCAMVEEVFIEGTQPNNAFSQTQAARLPDGTFCAPPPGLNLPPEALVTVVGLPLPADPQEAEEVRRWAPANGWPISGPPPCTPEQLAAIGAGNTLTYMIAQPTAGQVISSPVTVVGTVKWPAGQTGAWLLQLLGPDGQPRVLGGPSDAQVDNAALGMLDPAGLPQGAYTLRLAVALGDGTTPPPFDLPITIGAESTATPQPTETLPASSTPPPTGTAPPLPPTEPPTVPPPTAPASPTPPPPTATSAPTQPPPTATNPPAPTAVPTAVLPGAPAGPEASGAAPWAAISTSLVALAYWLRHRPWRP